MPESSNGTEAMTPPHQHHHARAVEPTKAELLQKLEDLMRVMAEERSEREAQARRADERIRELERQLSSTSANTSTTQVAKLQDEDGISTRVGEEDNISAVVPSSTTAGRVRTAETAAASSAKPTRSILRPGSASASSSLRGGGGGSTPASPRSFATLSRDASFTKYPTNSGSSTTAAHRRHRQQQQQQQTKRQPATNRPSGRGPPSVGGRYQNHSPASKQAWDALCDRAQSHMSVTELRLLSIETLRQLLPHYGFVDAVETAQIESYWAQLRQPSPSPSSDPRQRQVSPSRSSASPPPGSPTAGRRVREVQRTASPRPRTTTALFATPRSSSKNHQGGEADNEGRRVSSPRPPLPTRGSSASLLATRSEEPAVSKQSYLRRSSSAGPRMTMMATAPMVHEQPFDLCGLMGTPAPTLSRRQALSPDRMQTFKSDPNPQTLQRSASPRPFVKRFIRVEPAHGANPNQAVSSSVGVPSSNRKHRPAEVHRANPNESATPSGMPLSSRKHPQVGPTASHGSSSGGGADPSSVSPLHPSVSSRKHVLGPAAGKDDVIRTGLRTTVTKAVSGSAVPVERGVVPRTGLRCAPGGTSTTSGVFA